jgi:hypothetical protein
VTSLAAAHSQDDSTIALAGINSSVAEQKRNNNQHLRSFKIDYPRASADDAQPLKFAVTDQEGSEKTAPLSRASLFRTKGLESGADTYQRVLRLSPWRDVESTRVGAIATGFAPSGEIVFFNATPAPNEADGIGRIRLGSGEEAEDVDITDLDDGKFRAAYTNGVDVFTCQVSSGSKSSVAPDVSCVYSVPLPAKGKAKPKLRTLRFLSPTTLLLLQNAPDRGGCELLLLRLPKSGDTTPGKVTSRKRLHGSMRIGLGLDVCNLGANLEGQQQSIIAVSGSDLSIEVLTVDSDPRKGGGYGKLRPYTTLRDVHPFSMTKICFSTFLPPAHPVTAQVGPQAVKLASVSMGNTVVVHTLPLAPFPPPSKTPRYVLSQPGRSDAWDTFYFGFVALCSLLLTCVLLQAFAEVRGLTPPFLGSADWLPPHVRDAVARPYMFEPFHRTHHLDDILPDPTQQQTPDSEPEHSTQPFHSLRDLLLAHRDAGTIALTSDSESDVTSNRPSVIVRNTGPNADSVLVETADAASPEIRAQTVPWEELGEEQRAAWMQRLVDTGHWTVEESESILQGVLFGEYAGFVGSWVGRSLD